MVSIQTLSDRIGQNTAVVKDWLASKKLSDPSFDQDAPGDFHSAVGEPEVEAARLAIIEDTNELHDLISGPGEVLRRVCWGAVDNTVQQCIYHFKILQNVPMGKGITYEALATKVGLSQPQLKAIVRQSAMNRILREEGHDHVVHTASSAMLLRDGPLMDWYGHCVEELFPSGAKTAEALEKYQGSTSAADSAFGLAFNTTDSVYGFLEKNPERQARFFGAMESVGSDPGHSLDHIVTGYPWTELDGAVVVDVGGSSGFLSAAVAKAHPNLKKVVVQDYKHNVEQGAASLSPELASRVEFMPHNFFDKQPVQGADVYMMRHICHNWSKENCGKIIREIVPAMKPQSKLLLIEVVVKPSNSEESAIAERYMRNIDIAMLQMLNTQERNEEEWQEVVRTADPRLQITRILRPKGSWDSIIEVSLLS